MGRFAKWSTGHQSGDLKGCGVGKDWNADEKREESKNNFAYYARILSNIWQQMDSQQWLLLLIEPRERLLN